MVLLLCKRAKSPVHNFISCSLPLWQSLWDGAFRTRLVPSSQEYASNTLPPSLDERACLFFWGPLLPGPRSWTLLGGSSILLWAVQQWSRATSTSRIAETFQLIASHLTACPPPPSPLFAAVLRMLSSPNRLSIRQFTLSKSDNLVSSLLGLFSCPRSTPSDPSRSSSSLSPRSPPWTPSAGPPCPS